MLSLHRLQGTLLFSLVIVNHSQERETVVHQSHLRQSEVDEGKDDKFADEELDKILAEAGNNAQQLLRDCAAREAVDEIIEQIQPHTEVLDFFATRLANATWKANEQFPKAGSNKELDQLPAEAQTQEKD